MVPKPITAESKAELIRVAEVGQVLAAELLPLAKTARHQGNADYHVWNAVEFVVLFQFELNTCLKVVVQAQPGPEAKFHARSLLLTVLESLLTMKRLLAKEFRSQLVSALGDPALDRRLKSLHSEVNRLYEDYNSRYGELRNALVGHREADPEVRLRLLEVVDAEEAVLLALDALKVLTIFHQHIAEYTRDSWPRLLGLCQARSSKPRGCILRAPYRLVSDLIHPSQHCHRVPQVSLIHDRIAAEHRIGFPAAQLHNDVLSDTRPNEVASRRASEVVRGPTDQPGPDNRLQPATLYRGGSLARGAPRIEIGEDRPLRWNTVGTISPRSRSTASV